MQLLRIMGFSAPANTTMRKMCINYLVLLTYPK